MAFVETRRFRIWRVDVPCIEGPRKEDKSLEASRFPDLNILHLTDTHFNGKDKIKLDFLQAVFQGSGRLDFVFLTGDILDSPRGLDSCMEMADMIDAGVGAFAVLGGHDFYRYAELWKKYLSIHKNEPNQSLRTKPNPVEKLREGFSRRGISVLECDNRIIDFPGGHKLAIVGLNDTFFFNCDYEGAWKGVDNLPVIVLAHSPDVLSEAEKRGADLAFFGHTHGGQVRLPFKGAVVTRSKVGARRARGIFRENKTLFTINQGLGATRGTHIRLCCPPEITLMRISHQKNTFAQSYIPLAVVNSHNSFSKQS